MTPARFPRLRSKNPELARIQDNIGATLEPLAAAVAATPILGGSLPPWMRPAKLMSDLTQITGQAQTQFHIDALRYVHVKLALQTSAGVSAGQVLFNLPDGFRGAEQYPFPAFNTATSDYAAVGVLASGDVTTVNALGAGAGIIAYFSFLADQ